MDDAQWVLSFDVGTSCTGFAFGTDNNILAWGKYVADKKNADEGELLVEFSKWIDKNIVTLTKKPTRVVIESPYYKMNIRTYGQLMKYVGMVQREVYRQTGIECEFVSASSVKTKIGVKKGVTYQERKLNMVNHINSLFGLNLKFHKSNKKISDDDIADAIALLAVSLDMEL